MARTKYVYTIWKDNQHYIVDRKEFVRILSEDVYYDTTTYGWFGIDSANYEKGEQKTRWLTRTGTCLVVGHMNFRVFKEDYWKTYPSDWKKKYVDMRGKRL